MKSAFSMKRNLLEMLILGITLSLALLAGMFFCNMGVLFGYKDISCRQYTETRKFADELMALLERLDNAAEWTESMEFKSQNLSVTELKFDNDMLVMGSEEKLWTEDWLTSLDYVYMEGLYGIEGAEPEVVTGYNDAWYTITLSGGEIRQNSEFVTMSKEDYTQLFMKYTSQNGTDINDEEFSLNAYIGTYDGEKYVYSPDEDMFYSSLYGWYTVPERLYFKKSDIQLADTEITQNDSEKVTFETDAGAAVLGIRFASEEEVMKQLAGEDSVSYMLYKKDLEYNKRNIAYYVVAGKKRYTNVGNLENLVNCSEYLVIKPTLSGEYSVECHGFDNLYLSDEYVTDKMKEMGVLKPDDALYIGIYTTFPNYDIFKVDSKAFKQYYPYAIPAIVVMLLMIVASILLLIHIIRNCIGQDMPMKPKRLRLLDKLPVELVGALSLFGICFLGVGIYREFQEILGAAFYQLHILEILRVFWIGYIFLIAGVMIMIQRGKNGQLFEQSILRWTGCLIKEVAVGISGQKSLTARTVELFLFYWLGMIISGLIIWMSWNRYILILGAVMITALNLGALALMICQAKGEQKIRDLTQILASGDLEVQVEGGKHLATEREIIDNINHLSDGLQKAVEKNIYDERMKAELITNVSHDIKTPLTSIISYVDLIKRENVDNENVRHYIEILDHKSQRLKQLTEDLVEVSKLSTGNVELERVPIDFEELLKQTIGEFEDRFSAQKLQVVDSIEEQSYIIFADGRRTFRILENLFQNIYKYAMPQTRVYIDMEKRNGIIELAIKNISKSPLNIDASELMERFVRGDQSRTTEGSGLGLSIAQHLVELQDGEFQIYLDGDLFKTVIRFPEYRQEEVLESDAEPDTEKGTEESM